MKTKIHFTLLIVSFILLAVMTSCEKKHMHCDHEYLAQQSESLVMCPMCSGTGVFSMYGYSATCSSCKGTGLTTKENAEKLRKGLRQIDQATGGTGYGGGYSVDDGSGYSQGKNSNTNSGNNCHNCHGTGRCQFCKGVGVVRCKGQYGSEDGYMICPVCKGNKRCGVCGGRGKPR